MDSVVRLARTSLRRLLHQGATIEQAFQVARWARRIYVTGENQFAPLLDLVYLWSLPRFASYLAAAQISVSQDTPAQAPEPDPYLGGES